MRTIGRRLPSGHVPGDFHAYCDICGVLWYRSQLRVDGAGNLVCPDEGDGLDEVTLGELDARALERAHRPRDKQTGRPEQAESEFYTNPVSIIGRRNVLGWWAPERGLSATSALFVWRNEASVSNSGDIVGVDPASIPAASSNGVVFDSSTAMVVSPSGSLGQAGINLTLWVVATAGDEYAAGFQNFLEVGAFASDGSLVYGCVIARLKDATLGLNGEAYGTVKFAAGDAGLSVLATRPSNTTPHIYRFSVTTSAMELEVDDDTFTATPYANSGFVAPITSVSMGRNGNCTIHEAVVSNGVGSVNSDMKAYFRRRWPTIPALGTETTQAGVTI